MTMVLPAGTSPAACFLIRPATPAAEPGSTKTPSLADSQRCAARISSSVTESISPPDSSRAAMAVSQEAGLPIRMAVAMVSGSVIGWPAPTGRRRRPGSPTCVGVLVDDRAERAGGGGLVRRGVLLVALPVGGDVARVAHRQHVDVRGVAQVVDDLEGAGLLALDAGRVDRVHQEHRVGLAELAGDLQAVVEVAVDLDAVSAPCAIAWLSLPMEILPSGTSTAHFSPACGGVGGGGGGGVAGGGADHGLGAGLDGGGHGHGHAAVLEGAGGVHALDLEVHLASRSARRAPGRAPAGCRPRPA